jgi:lipopolysaccharide export system protein LptA
MIFQERLNKELSAFGFPLDKEERIRMFSEIFKLSKHTSASIIYGSIIPEKKMVKIVASELSVSEDWLLGLSNKKRPELPIA